MQLSSVQRGLIISVVLHLLLALVFVRSRLDGVDSNVAVHVQYQESGASSDMTESRVPVIDAGAKLKSVESAGKAGAARDTKASSDVGVSGESLGLKARYPKLSRVLGESGQVQVEVQRSNQSVIVRTSSGFKRLDESAVATLQSALQNGSFEKLFGERESILINFVFRLNEGASGQ